MLRTLRRAFRTAYYQSSSMCQRIDGQVELQKAGRSKKPDLLVSIQRPILRSNCSAGRCLVVVGLRLTDRLTDEPSFEGGRELAAAKHIPRWISGLRVNRFVCFQGVNGPTANCADGSWHCHVGQCLRGPMELRPEDSEGRSADTIVR